MSVQADFQCRSSNPALVPVPRCSFLQVWKYIIPAVSGIIHLGLPWSREVILSTVLFWNWHFYFSLDTKPLAKRGLSWWCFVCLGMHITCPCDGCVSFSFRVCTFSIHSKLATGEYFPSKLACWHIWSKQFQSHWRVREHKLQGWLKSGCHQSGRRGEVYSITVMCI